MLERFVRKLVDGGAAAIRTEQFSSRPEILGKISTIRGTVDQKGRIGRSDGIHNGKKTFGAGSLA
jgi:hypothetical protein